MAESPVSEHDRLYRVRHSIAHVMAQAVLERYPEAKVGIGPPIENGFYYDIAIDKTLTPEDLQPIEKRMKELINTEYDVVVKVEIGRAHV